MQARPDAARGMNPQKRRGLLQEGQAPRTTTKYEGRPEGGNAPGEGKSEGCQDRGAKGRPATATPPALRARSGRAGHTSAAGLLQRRPTAISQRDARSRRAGTSGTLAAACAAPGGDGPWFRPRHRWPRRDRRFPPILAIGFWQRRVSTHGLA